MCEWCRLVPAMISTRENPALLGTIWLADLQGSIAFEGSFRVRPELTLMHSMKGNNFGRRIRIDFAKVNSCDKTKKRERRNDEVTARKPGMHHQSGTRGSGSAGSCSLGKVPGRVVPRIPFLRLCELDLLRERVEMSLRERFRVKVVHFEIERSQRARWIDPRLRWVL